MSRRKSKRRGRKRGGQPSRRVSKVLKQRMKANFPNQKVVFRKTSDGLKMSEVLEKFIEPYRESVGTNKETYQELLVMATVAWNVTLFPVEKRRCMVDELVGTLPEEVRQDGREIIRELMVRKERFFSQYRRMVVDFELEGAGDKWHLSVMSTAEPIADG